MPAVLVLGGSTEPAQSPIILLNQQPLRLCFPSMFSFVYFGVVPHGVEMVPLGQGTGGFQVLPGFQSSSARTFAASMIT